MRLHCRVNGGVVGVKNRLDGNSILEVAVGLPRQFDGCSLALHRSCADGVAERVVKFLPDLDAVARPRLAIFLAGLCGNILDYAGHKLTLWRLYWRRCRRSIGNGAFEGCTGLTGVKLPPSITSIGDLAFYGCTGLTGVKLPPSITSIGNLAFYGCTGLTGVDFAHHKALYIDKGWWQIGCKCQRFEWWTGSEGRAFARANGYTSEEYEAGIKLAREFAAIKERQ